MTDTHPFQARDRGDGILEIIGIFPGMTLDHPAVVALASLARKFRHILFTLEPGASLDAIVLPKLIEVSGLTDLRIVTSDPTALPYEKAGLSIFSTPEEAISRIRCDAKLKQITSKMDSVPQLHSQAFEMLQKLNDPNTSFGDLETMISNDPGLSAQILKSANSAFFMRHTKVETLGAAMAYLGIEGLKQLLMFNVFKGLSGLAGAQKEVMDHGRACGHLASFLAEKAKVPKPILGKIRLAGLLHDVGSLAMAFVFPAEFQHTRELVHTQGKRTYEAELEVFGIEHQQVGQALATRWSFPDYLVRVIGDHHHLRDPRWDQIAGPVFCANGYLNQVIENIPFTVYYQKLRGFFAQLDEQTSIQELQELLKKELDSFIAAGGLSCD